MSLSQPQSTTNRQRGLYDLDVEAVKSAGQRHYFVAGVKAVAEIGQSAQYNERTSRSQDHIPIDRRQSLRAVESMLAPAVAASARSADIRGQIDLVHLPRNWKSKCTAQLIWPEIRM
jgi:hypothetical protein